ncbi:hypothetical protein B9Z55_003273 [Caenorhabditis nigoni]|uniref:Uncharacterized protein n=1 Tax=Caenorhabditis nigoni TaxID=1611254 RepID=A0A2G5VPF2_9PELO|nr:hypothetical protein B9Z55_003273 [Caenorhabditis nigoni]
MVHRRLFEQRTIRVALMGTLAPSGWRATIWTPPPAMEKAEEGWQLAGTTVRFSKMWQGLTRGAEVNVGMRQATTDWTQEVTVLEQNLADEAATGSVSCSMVDVDYRRTFSHNKGSDRHRRKKGSNVFYNGRTVRQSKTNDLGLFIGEFGNSHSGATNELISKLAPPEPLSHERFQKGLFTNAIGRKELFEGPSKRQHQDCSKKNYRLVRNRHADQHEVYQQDRERTRQHRRIR